MPALLERENTGWAGGRSPVASDKREPEWERPWVGGAALFIRLDVLVLRFMADGGWGIDEPLPLMPPRVWWWLEGVWLAQILRSTI